MKQPEHTQERDKKKGVRLKVAVTSFLVLIGVVIGLAVWQRDNIDALLKFNQYSQEELEEKLDENDKVIQSVTESIPEVNVRPVTEEEKQALQNGSMTQEELVQNLQKPADTENAPVEKPAEKPAEKPKDPPAQSEQPEQPPEQPGYQEQVSEIIATIYVMREEYLIELDALKDAAAAEYYDMEESEKDSDSLMKFVGSYASKALELEKQCDARMLSIVTELENLLKENGGDVSLAQKVYDTYVEEKSLKKAWYMAELTKRGLSYS